MAGRINVSICNVVFPFVFLQSDTWYYCPYCPKGYSYKHHLQRHLLVHSAIKPYNCEQCDFSTTRIDSLKRHILNNHNGAAGLPSALQWNILTEKIIMLFLNLVSARKSEFWVPEINLWNSLQPVNTLKKKWSNNIKNAGNVLPDYHH